MTDTNEPTHEIPDAPWRRDFNLDRIHHLLLCIGKERIEEKIVCEHHRKLVEAVSSFCRKRDQSPTN
jgi:hypothetical protein